MLKQILTLIAAPLAAFGWAQAAEAAYTVNIVQVGADVRITGSGSIDLTGLVFQNRAGIGSGKGLIRAEDAYLFIAATNDVNVYLGLTGPSSFGPSTRIISSDEDAGNSVAVQFGSTGTLLFVPTGYVSGSQLGVSTATYRDATLASLGFTSASYAYTTPTSDTFTINVGDQVAAVPEPATWAMMLVGFGLIGATSRYRRRTTIASIT